jgi:hypothetical protein
MRLLREAARASDTDMLRQTPPDALAVDSLPYSDNKTFTYTGVLDIHVKSVSSPTYPTINKTFRHKIRHKE